MGLITRTCNLVLLAILFNAPAAANTPPRSALSHYVEARMFDVENSGNQAVRAYSDALTEAPDEERVIRHAYRRAVETGDKALAVRAAQALDAQHILAADARVLLFSEALNKADWRGANLRLDQMEESGEFDFLVPILRAWVRFAARDGDPLAMLIAPMKDGFTAIYAQEQRALLLFALKRTAEGLAEIKTIPASDSHLSSVKLAAAARLVALKDRAGALLLLSGKEGALVRARILIEAGKPLAGSIDSASKGAAFLFSRVASDLVSDRQSPAALALTRLSSFAAPPTDDRTLALARALSMNGQSDEALRLLDTIDKISPFAPASHDLRIAVLARAGRHEEALTIAKQALEGAEPNALDYVRIGDAYNQLDYFREAAAAYDLAIKHVGLDKGEGGVPWNLWLLYGGALDEAKDWARAKPALQKAVALGGDQPVALNHLGYAMLEHKDNLDEAIRLIAKASALRPDDAAITDSLGYAYLLRGDTDQSIRILEKAVAAEPTLAEVGEHLGDAYWQAGRRVDARYAWAAALIQSEDGNASQRIGTKIANGLTARK